MAIIIKSQVNGHEMSEVMVQIAMSSTHPALFWKHRQRRLVRPSTATAFMLTGVQSVC